MVPLIKLHFIVKPDPIVPSWADPDDRRLFFDLNFDCGGWRILRGRKVICI
jgi:hypothetical protein